LQKLPEQFAPRIHVFAAEIEMGRKSGCIEPTMLLQIDASRHALPMRREE